LGPDGSSSPSGDEAELPLDTILPALPDLNADYMACTYSTPAIR
jgi:hypothetical protein